MNRCRSLIPVLMIATMSGGILFMAAGCNKKEEPVVRSYKISGTIYYDCAKKPYAGQMLELVHYTSTSANSFSGGIQTITDQFGHFSFTYTDNKGDGYFSNEYQIFTKNYNGARKLLISRIPGTGSLNIGNLYVANKIKLFVDIKVRINKGGISDTLFFGISESEYHYITPIINTADLYEFNAPARLYNDNKPFSTNSFFFAVGREAYLDNFTALTDNNTVQAAHLVYESEYLSGEDCAQQHIVDTVRVEL